MNTRRFTRARYFRDARGPSENARTETISRDRRSLRRAELAAGAVPLGQNVEAFGGVAANVYVTDVMNDNSDNFHPTMARTYDPTDSTKVVLWPSAFVGVRVKAK